MKDIIRKLLFILPERDYIKISILFILMMIAAAFEVIGIGMIPAFVSIVASPDRVLEIELLQGVFSYLEISTSRDLLIWGGIALVVIFIVKGAYVIFYSYISARFTQNRRYLISQRLMSSYMQAPYTFHLQRNTAELLRNITQEVSILIGKVLTSILTLAKDGIMIISILTFLILMEPVITLVVIVITGLGSGVFVLFTRGKVKAYGEREQQHRSGMIKAVNQGLGGIKDARVLNREQEFIEKFRFEALNSAKYLTYISYIRKIPHAVIETIAVFGMMIIAGVLVWQGREISAIIPIMALFGMAILRLMPAVRRLTSDYTYLIYNLVSLNPIYEDLQELDSENKLFKEDRVKSDTLELKDSIDADDIHYAYPESDEQALNGVSFRIKRGQAVAFVGESGAGKTTIVDLILGLMKPAKGTITVDGRDIHGSISAWQRNLGYIPQSIYLADETLRSNIAFGLPESEIDDNQVMQAVELAQLGSLVERLPDGLNTIIGENGTRLSGGQRQRVGIARALYHDPQVLVMDEATSALDNITEKEITRAIEALKGDRTVIMIAHRLSTVENCDVLYLMKDGKIIDAGGYDDLIHKNDDFKKMALVT